MSRPSPERPVRTVRHLAQRLARATGPLRDRVLWLLDQPTTEGEEARALYATWKVQFHADATPVDFADGWSQVVACAHVLHALDGEGPDSPGAVMDLPLLGGASEEVEALARLTSALDVEALTSAPDARGDPWLVFYEDFLGAHDAAARKRAGVFFTPLPLVRAMVDLVDHLLVHVLGFPGGFMDEGVVTLDPAAGSGTFPLAVLDQGALRLGRLHGPKGAARAAHMGARNLLGLELLPGPHAVSRLRLVRRLRDLDPAGRHQVRLFLGDTLRALDAPTTTDRARALAREVVEHQPVTVVLGNPPYRRTRRGDGETCPGAWDLDRDVREVARRHGLGIHLKNACNLYARFWRWALWKVFEAHGDRPGLVAFVTASSWLTGDAFVGLRELARRRCDAIWVLDLGGEGRGTLPDENVFSVQTPVSVVLLVRAGAQDLDAPAPVRYRRLQGSARQKLAAMEALASLARPFEGDWEEAPSGWTDPFVPQSPSRSWALMPALTDLFPWQHSGLQFKRTWPIAPDSGTLIRRWQVLANLPEGERAAAFRESRDRSVPPIQDGPPPPVVPIGYRSFDVQQVFLDPRVGDFLRPALVGTRSDRQVYLTSLLSGRVGPGPALVACAHPPDLHHFRGSYGARDVIPLYRDARGTCPNLAAGLLAALGRLLSLPDPSPPELASYVYALLSAPAYQHRFAQDLRTPGPRVPLTLDPTLWREAVALGRWLLWLHTFGERMGCEEFGPFPPPMPDLAWAAPVVSMPQRTAQVSYDRDRQELRVGDGMVRGVGPQVWDFKVSGMAVVKKWLAHRTATGSGRAATASSLLDRVRPTTWTAEWSRDLLVLLQVLSRTVQAHDRQANLLDRICAGPLMEAANLPAPGPGDRRPPRRG